MIGQAAVNLVLVVLVLLLVVVVVVVILLLLVLFVRKYSMIGRTAVNLASGC